MAGGVIQDRVEPEQRAQRPVAITRVVGDCIESRKEQGCQRIGLGRLSFLAVTAASVPPEASAEGRVPQPGALEEQEISFTSGCVDLAPHRVVISGRARSVEERQAPDEVIVAKSGTPG